MRIVLHRHGFEFDDNRTVEHQVGDVGANNATLEPHIDRPLLLDGVAGVAELVRQCVFINLLVEPSSQAIGDRERAADDRPRQRIAIRKIVGHPVHRWTIFPCATTTSVVRHTSSPPDDAMATIGYKPRYA